MAKTTLLFLCSLLFSFIGAFQGDWVHVLGGLLFSLTCIELRKSKEQTRRVRGAYFSLVEALILSPTTSVKDFLSTHQFKYPSEEHEQGNLPRS